MVFNPNSSSTGIKKGSLLVATPSMRDPNFEKSVIMLSNHDESEGSVGVVLNRPLQHSLGELVEAFEGTELADAPVYSGGPVQQNQLILVAWKDGGEVSSDWQFGLSKEQAMEILTSDSEMVVSAFLGYAGWSSGQLAGEIAENSWYCMDGTGEVLSRADEGNAIWVELVHQYEPDLKKYLQAPDDPSLN